MFKFFCHAGQDWDPSTFDIVWISGLLFAVPDITAISKHRSGKT
jgi:hypothetical protein